MLRRAHGCGDGGGRAGQCQRAASAWTSTASRQVNDTLGHPVGDALLRAVAERLRGALRETDTVARLGGDEFAIVQSRVEQPTEATALAAAPDRADRARPSRSTGHQIVIGTSIGIAFAPQDGTDADQLLRSADLALYRAKSDGRGVYRLLRAGDGRADAGAARAGARSAAGAVQRAVRGLLPAADQICTTRPVSGFEALLRWRHPAARAGPAGRLHPAGRGDRPDHADRRVGAAQACAEAAPGPATSGSRSTSRRRSSPSRGLVALVWTRCSASALPPDRLELEITETVLLQDTEATLATLHQLQALGVADLDGRFRHRLFLAELPAQLPVRQVKIDQSFIRELGTTRTAPPSCARSSTSCRTLGMTTTAEGVETRGAARLAARRSAAPRCRATCSARRAQRRIPLLLRMINGTPIAAVA